MSEVMQMRLPRVAVVTPGTFPIPSGASSSVERVVEYVVSLASNRVAARIYGKQWPGQAKTDTVRGVSCERVRASNNRKYIQSIIRLLVEDQPDIIQIENRPRFVLAVRRALPSARIWLNLHSTTFMQSRHISNRMLRMALRTADRIFVNSRFLYEQVVRAVPESSSHIVINPLGVDGSRFISRWCEAGAERSFSGKQLHGWEQRRIILFVGRLIPLKGVHHLLQAVPSVVHRHEDALFVIVGGVSYGRNRKTRYVRRLERLGRRYPQHVRFIPYVSHEEIPSWYAMAELAVVPSVEREAFGLVNVEAMATGIPVVATRVGGIQEVVTDQVTGLLIAPQHLTNRLAEAINHLLEDAALRERMGRAGVVHVESSFTWQRTADRWADEVYARMNLIDDRIDAPLDPFVTG
ncbi:glycosyltransferase family 4 protein [Paenibacillus marinisediminis]